jgi:uncharacterized membrane protein YebE (DUF533 family)
MISNGDKDGTATLAGTGAMMALLANVKWDQIPEGELFKVTVAIGLGVLGYLAYRKEESSK